MVVNHTPQGETEMSREQQTPEQIDTQLAALYERMARAQYELDRAQEAVRRVNGTATHALARASAHLTEVEAKLQAIVAEAAPLEAEYDARRWSRYFLVTNGNGHVHRERRCVTCYPTTRYGWLPALSGCDEAVMVAEYGEQACSVCFPNAPSLYAQLKTKGLVSRTQAEREAKRSEREAKRAAAEAQRQAKAIANPDGTPLMGTSRWAITTLAEAKRELAQITEVQLGGFGQAGSWNDEHREAIRAAYWRILAALAHKLGVPAAELKAAAEAKVAKEHKSWTRNGGRACGCPSHVVEGAAAPTLTPNPQEG
jgi:hypothetical protein